MSTRSSTKKLILVVVTVVFLVTLITCALFPRVIQGTWFIVSSIVNEVMFNLKGNRGIVWFALDPQGPGFTGLKVLSHEGDVWERPGIFITFQVEIDTTETPLLCYGQLQFFRSDPDYIKLDWQKENCAEQHQIVRLADFTMTEDSLRAVLPEEYMAPASKLLVHWIGEGKIKLQDIKHPRMYGLVKSQMNSYP